MSKPIILAICGKSATGKDSLAKWLYKDLTVRGVKTSSLVSHTSRPKRVNEVEGVDYVFLSKKEFLSNLINDEEYLEYTKFKDWWYGTPKSAVTSYLNIGVFNVEGIIALQKCEDFEVIPIYLEDKLFTRLKRSKERERKWRIEYIRRAFSDWKDFYKVKDVLASFSHYIVLTEQEGVVRKTQAIESALKEWSII